MQTKSRHDVNQEENSCTVHEKEPNNLQPKHCPESGNHASKFDEVSPSSKPNAYGVQKKPSSGARNDALESHEEEKIVTYMKDKDPDMLMRKQISNPEITSQESNPPIVSHLRKDEKAVEKLLPRRNLETGVKGLQSDEGSIPSKVPGDASKISNDEPDSLNLKQNPYSGVQTSEMYDSEKTNGKRERTSDILLPVESFRGQSASQSDKQKSNYLTRPEKTVKKLHPRRNPETGGRSSKSDQVAIPLSEHGNLSTIAKEPKPNNLQPTQCLDVGNHELTSKEEKVTSERQTNPGNLVQASSLSIGVPVSQSDPENFTYSKRNEKVEKLQPRRNPDPVVQGSQCVVESTSTKIPDKGLNEGYNWRKYGQKLVKGSEFVRSYYRCTYPNCQAKKQVERSHDGCKTEVNYLGRHHHPKPQHSPQVSSAFHDRVPEIPIATVSKSHAELIIGQGGAKEQGVTTESTVPRCDVTRALSCSSNDNDKDGHPDSKRQQHLHDKKTEISSVDDKPNNDLRHVVQTLSEVDMVNDGYRWRKYGQKLVKGNPNPRSYYRCSNAGCAAKKHVERASHDSKMVITTYEGHHSHDIPPSRTVNQSTTRGDANTTAINGEPRSEPQENKSVTLETVVHASAN